MRSEIQIERTALPAELRERDQWVCWREESRDGKPTKIPVTPGSGEFASSTDPDTWASVSTALEYADSREADGVGFVFTDDDSIVGVDLNDCRDPETGDVDDVAQDIIERLDSYTEIYPSGTGFHVLIEGALPDGRNRRGSVELYDTARFFTVIGDSLEEMPGHVARRQDALEAIHQEYVQDTDTNSKSDSKSRGVTNEQVSTDTAVDTTVDLKDESCSRRLEMHRTDQSSSVFGTGTRLGTRASRKPIWRCVVCWRSGPVATTLEWIDFSASLVFSGRSGTTSTMAMARHTARRLSNEQ